MVAVPNHGRGAKQFHGYFTSIPSNIIQLPGLQRPEVFLFSKRSTRRINQLKIFAVQSASRIDVDVNE